MLLEGIVLATGMSSDDVGKIHDTDVGQTVNHAQQEVAEAVCIAQNTKVDRINYQNSTGVVYEIVSKAKDYISITFQVEEEKITEVSETQTAYSGRHTADKRKTESTTTSTSDSFISQESLTQENLNTTPPAEQQKIIETKALADLMHIPFFPRDRETAVYERIRTAIEGHILSYVKYDLAHAALCAG